MDDKVSKNRQAKGADNGGAKLTEEQVEEIRGLYLKGIYSQRYLSTMYGVSQMQISRTVNHKSWKQLPALKHRKGQNEQQK